MDLSCYSSLDPMSRAIEKFSDPSLTTPSALGVHMVTNEIGLEDSTPVYRTEVPTPTGCHMGVAAFHNFDIMAIRKSERGIIFDINPDNRKFMKGILRILRSSSSRIAFIDTVVREYISCVPHPICIAMSFDPSFDTDKDELRGQLRKETSWLFTEERFNHIKRLAAEGKIAVITVDIRQTTTFERLTRILRDNGIVIDSVYLSNVGTWMDQGEDQERFSATVEALSNGAKFVTYAYGRPQGDGTYSLTQTVHRGLLVTKQATPPIFCSSASSLDITRGEPSGRERILGEPAEKPSLLSKVRSVFSCCLPCLAA